MGTTPIQSGSSVLRPRARLIKTIGEELISSDIVAILELVKNSYDADATIIEIKFNGKVVEIEEGKKKVRVLEKDNTSIIISDDGIGMSLETIKSSWMEPATINKKKEKVSPGKARRYTGEKGIGRFASAKLASDLKMVTKKEKDNEVVANFRWSDFGDEEKYLDQISCQWEVRTPIEIKKKGTTLYITNLNSNWDEHKLRTLRIALSRLINPISPIPDFLMDLTLPEGLEDLSGDIEPPSSLLKPIYSIKGNVNEVGVGHLIYNSVNIPEPQPFEIDFNKEIRPIRQIQSGAFSFEFNIWDRDGKTLKKLALDTESTLKNVKEDLDALGGISIYRDDFRVLPYGEPKNDWLRLDLRRVQSPTLRISNNQIIGYISTSLATNPEFKDQSNREGLVESSAFIDLQEIIKAILNQLEVRRYAERRLDQEQTPKQTLFANFAVRNYLQIITDKHPEDKDIREAIERAEKSIERGIKKVQEVLSQYRRLSTLGLLVDVILHDGNNYLAILDGEAVLLEEELEKKGRNEQTISIILKNIIEVRKSLAQLFRRLEPFGGRKKGAPKEIVLEEAIRNVFELHKTDLFRLKINILLPDSKSIVRIDEGELQFIFVNLLQNSIYWLESVEGERRITIEVEKDNESVSIVFSDNGPGVKEEYHSLIFDPYFSTKPNGIGLGLTIVGELVTEYDGEFYLIENGPLDGATFKLIFKRRI